MKFCEKIANIEKIHHSGTKIAVRSLNCLNKLQKQMPENMIPGHIIYLKNIKKHQSYTKQGQFNQELYFQIWTCEMFLLKLCHTQNSIQTQHNLSDFDWLPRLLRYSFSHFFFYKITSICCWYIILYSHYLERICHDLLNKLLPRKFKGGICCGSHLAVTYGGELSYLRIFS